MKLPRELTTVTRLSKFVALIMFITLPIIAFAFGMNFKAYVEENPTLFVAQVPAADKQTVDDEYPCELDVTVCPDNSLIGRVPPQCKFGKCEVESEPSSAAFVCPRSGYVDCEPGPGGIKLECTTSYLDWAQANCPNFMGAAY